MRYYVLAIAASAALAQSVSNTYMTDLNGRRVETDKVVTTDHQQTSVIQSINGRLVPMQQTEERVLRESGGTKVTEKIIRNYDRDGRLASTDRELIEESARPSGSTTHITRYQTDVNDRTKETERRTIDTEKQGSVVRTESKVERPTLNGSFQTVEKSSIVTQNSATGSQSDQTTYQLSSNGGYVVSARLITEKSKNGNRTTER